MFWFLLICFIIVFFNILSAKEEKKARKKNKRLERERREREKLAREATASPSKDGKISDDILKELELLDPFVSEKERKIRFLKSMGIDCFYHFTDRKNLESIIKLGGLYSWNYLETNGLGYVNSGGNIISRNLDKRKNLQDYVRLSFNNNLPMKWHREQQGYNIVTLKIALSVINEDMLVSDINATDTNCKFSKGYKGLNIVNYRAVKMGKCYRTDPLFKQRQAEILIKTKVPLEYITNLETLRNYRFLK